MRQFLRKKTDKSRKDVRGFMCPEECSTTCSGYCADGCSGHCGGTCSFNCSSFCNRWVF